MMLKNFNFKFCNPRIFQWDLCVTRGSNNEHEEIFNFGICFELVKYITSQGTRIFAKAAPEPSKTLKIFRGKNANQICYSFKKKCFGSPNQRMEKLP